MKDYLDVWMVFDELEGDVLAGSLGDGDVGIGFPVAFGRVRVETRWRGVSDASRGDDTRGFS